MELLRSPLPPSPPTTEEPSPFPTTAYFPWCLPTRTSPPHRHTIPLFLASCESWKTFLFFSPKKRLPTLINTNRDKECKLSRQVKGHHLGTIYNCVVVMHHCDFIWAEDDVIIWTGAQILCKSLMLTFPQQKVNKEKFPADRHRQPRQRQHAPTVGRLMCDLSKSCCQRAHCHAQPPDGVDAPMCVAHFSACGGLGAS